MYPVELHSDRLVIREFASTDLDSVLAIVGDDEVTKHLSFDSRDREQTVAMLQGILERARYSPRVEYYFATALIDDPDVVIGFVRLGLDGVQAAKLGYAIRPSHWGCGYATEASRRVVDFGFQQLGLHRISAAIGPDNDSSIGVVTQLGMRYEGTIRDHVFTNGAWRDSQLYSVLRSEWPAEATRASNQTSPAA